MASKSLIFSIRGAVNYSDGMYRFSFGPTAFSLSFFFCIFFGKSGALSASGCRVDIPTADYSMCVGYLVGAIAVARHLPY